MGRENISLPKKSTETLHFLQDVQEPSIREIEMRFETVNRDGHPVGVAAVLALEGGFCVSHDGFLGEPDDLLRETGYLRLHNRSDPLHFLVS
jgi:hypothetical protein